MSAYYNENDPYAAQWLRNLIAADLIAPGDVDDRSIVDVLPGDLAGYTQCHFFAGVGGWSYAARLAGWPDDRPLWTGSCPCQPFSVAGAGRGDADERHLWPHLFRLVGAGRPPVLMGEQVAAAVGKNWLDGVFADLEGVGYACGAAVVPACAVNAPHRRERLWFVANADQFGAGEERQQRGGQLGGAGGDPRHCALGDTRGSGLAFGPRLPEQRGIVRGKGQATTEAGARHPWRGASLLSGANGKSRRVEPSIRLLAHGLPARVGRLRAYGNAIVPQVAAEMIAAFLEAA